ncbi:MAG: hypothetical protein K2J53_00155, partial [Alistipes sp.]|nr:hypothetical protein [Alistipes sp.]
RAKVTEFSGFGHTDPAKSAEKPGSGTFRSKKEKPDGPGFRIPDFNYNFAAQWGKWTTKSCA